MGGRGPHRRDRQARKIVERDRQIGCIEALFAEVSHGRRRRLVEVATGTGKTRTEAAFVKRLFEAGIVTRVLFLVDRVALARQDEDAFTDDLPDNPCHLLRPGRLFDRAKLITVATLQTMIAGYADLSPGQFDLVITDECHRSVYGNCSDVLPQFDSIQFGLTATLCSADADMLRDPRNGLFVRDALRFFDLAEPAFRCPPSRGGRGRPSGTLPHLIGDDGEVRRCRRFSGRTRRTRLERDEQKYTGRVRGTALRVRYDHGGPDSRRHRTVCTLLALDASKSH